MSHGIDWDRIGSTYHDIASLRNLCDQIAGERDEALALLKEIRETQFVGDWILPRVNVLLADEPFVPRGEPQLRLEMEEKEKR
jgi:hypothetical protein